MYASPFLSKHVTQQVTYKTAKNQLTNSRKYENNKTQNQKQTQSPPKSESCLTDDWKHKGSVPAGYINLDNSRIYVLHNLSDQLALPISPKALGEPIVSNVRSTKKFPFPFIRDGLCNILYGKECHRREKSGQHQRKPSHGTLPATPRKVAEFWDPKHLTAWWVPMNWKNTAFTQKESYYLLFLLRIWALPARNLWVWNCKEYNKINTKVNILPHFRWFILPKVSLAFKMCNLSRRESPIHVQALGFVKWQLYIFLQRNFISVD